MNDTSIPLKAESANGVGIQSIRTDHCSLHYSISRRPWEGFWPWGTGYRQHLRHAHRSTPPPPFLPFQAISSFDENHTAGVNVKGAFHCNQAHGGGARSLQLSPQVFVCAYDMCVIVCAQGDKIAFLWEGNDGEEDKMTYAELLEQTSKLANVLKKHGVMEGDKVCDVGSAVFLTPTNVRQSAGLLPLIVY